MSLPVLPAAPSRAPRSPPPSRSSEGGPGGGLVFLCASSRPEGPSLVPLSLSFLQLPHVHAVRCPGSPGLDIPPGPCRPPKQPQADSAPAPGVRWLPKRHRQLSITETDRSPSPAFSISAGGLPGGLDAWTSPFNPPQSQLSNWWY